ncbi:MAG: cyclic nucleotide-binding domain-containing protein [Spirochaetales bacterium]|nr:cyclic nucleotide-binding domain-containing protein [Spirochaetales bacterium]
MSIVGTRKYDKEPFSRETLILLQGSQNKTFVVLHSGLVEILYCDNPLPDESGSDILKRSLRIGLVKGEAILGASTLLDGHEPSPYSLRTVSDCIISSAPVDSEEMARRVQRNMSFNLRILRNMVVQIESGLYLYRNYKYLWHKVAFIADTIALSSPVPPAEGKPEGEDISVPRIGSDFTAYGHFLHNQTKEGEDCAEPREWDANLFQGEIQESLKLYADHDDLRAEDRFDYRQYLFIKRIAEKDRKILSALFQRDEPLNFYIFEFLSQVQNEVQLVVADLSREIWLLMNQVFGDEGWVKEICRQGAASGSEAEQFLYYLFIFSSRCRKDSMNLLGKDIFTEYSSMFDDLKKYKNYTPQTETEEEQTAPEREEKAAIPPGARKKLAKYQGLLDRILTFSGLSAEFQEEFSRLMDRLLGCEDILSPDREVAQLREQANRMYWKLYKSCFLKVIGTDLKGFVPGILLHFGLLDERFLSTEDLIEVDRLYASNLYSQDPIPVMTLPYYLEKIYNSSLKPSLSEMGDSFEDILKRQEKMTPKERSAADHIYKDVPADRIHFELMNITGEVAQMLSGNKKRFLPFLCSTAMEGIPANSFLHPDQTAGIVNSYRKRDYTLFYREVLFTHGSGREIIQSEVFPCFVLYPQFGSRAVMWQEMDGKKNTPGRLFIPLFFTGKREETLPYLLGEYRWELQKSIAGYQWTDPVEGGVVGAYYDYIQFFRKNPEISAEAKQRITEFIKKTKSDKDRFARDYISWIIHEYEGRPKLNPYIRGIFYRYCPFPWDMRSEMAQKPLFAEAEMKFQNRRQKEILRVKSKLKKLGDETPRELKDYLTVYLECFSEEVSS